MEGWAGMPCGGGGSSLTNVVHQEARRLCEGSQDNTKGIKIPREEQLERGRDIEEEKMLDDLPLCGVDVPGGGAEELDSQVGKSRRRARAEGGSATSLDGDT